MRTLLRLLRSTAEGTPQAAAAFTPQGTLDYATLCESVERAARGLLEAGLGRGVRVGLLSDNSLRHLVLGYAIPAAGAVLVDIDPNRPAHDITGIVKAAGLTAMVVDDDHRALAAEFARLGGPPCLSCDELPTRSSQSLPDDGDAPAVMVGHLGGRPGRERPLTQGDLLEAAARTGARLRLMAEDRYLHFLPMAGTQDLIVGLAATAAGASHAFGRDSTPGALREAVERERISVTLVGPGMLSALRRDPQTYGADLTSLRVVVALEPDLAPDRQAALPDLGFEVQTIGELAGDGLGDIDLTVSETLLTTMSGQPD